MAGCRGVESAGEEGVGGGGGDEGDEDDEGGGGDFIYCVGGEICGTATWPTMDLADCRDPENRGSG